MKLSQRAAAIEPSSTLALSERANELRAQGRPVLSFTAGEPDFPTPEPICLAAWEAIQRGQTRYTATTGLLELREGIANYLQETRGVTLQPGQIVVTAGVKQAVLFTLQTLLDPGDEILGITPYWVTYPWAAHIVGVRFVPAPSTPDCRPDIAALEERVTDRTRALLINSPNNPSGAVYDRDEMKALSEFARRKGLWLISDDIYEDLVFGDSPWVSPYHVADDHDHIICLSGFSKSYAMTGWRVGYFAGPQHIAKAMAAVQGHSSGNIATPSQAAAIEALRSGRACVDTMRREFEARRDAIHVGLTNIPGIECPKPSGAFYALPSVKNFLGERYASDVELAEALLDRADLAVVPGSSFGASGHIRFSYATSIENIREGLNRLAAFLT